MANVQQLRRSPLAARSEEMRNASVEAVTVREIPFTTQVGIRTEGARGIPHWLKHLVVTHQSRRRRPTTAVVALPDEFLAIDLPDTQLAGPERTLADNPVRC